MRSIAPRFPARQLTLALVRRGLGLWVLARAMLLVVGITSTSGGSPQMSPLAALMLVALVGLLGVLESRRMNEHRFFANLGVSPVTAGLLVMLPAVVGEVVIGIVVSR